MKKTTKKKAAVEAAVSNLGVAAPKPRTLLPLGGRVLIKRGTAESVSPGGVIIPESAKDKPLEGVVDSVGDGKMHPVTGKLFPVRVKPGMRVMFKPYVGFELKLDNADYVVLDEADIVGVLT